MKTFLFQIKLFNDQYHKTPRMARYDKLVSFNLHTFLFFEGKEGACPSETYYSCSAHAESKVQALTSNISLR